MKVNQNISLFAGVDADPYAYNTTAGKTGKANKGSKSFHGSYLNGQFDPIERKRALAQKRVKKIIGDTNTGERKLDNDLSERAARLDEHHRVLSENSKTVKEIDEKKEQLRQEYGVEKDSQEQKDLEILEKYNRKKRNVVGQFMSPDELARAKELEGQGYGEKGYTEYQQRALEADSGKDIPLLKIQEAKQGIYEESGTIRATKLERLKYHKMIDANKDAEKILEAASDEIKGMLIEEAKDNIDEKNEEEQEKVEEGKEEKKEEQEKLEAAKERKELMEALADPEKAEEHVQRREREESDAMWGDPMTEGLLKMQNVKSNVQQEVSDMMLKMKLVAEDVKGLNVDELL